MSTTKRANRKEVAEKKGERTQEVLYADVQEEDTPAVRMENGGSQARIRGQLTKGDAGEVDNKQNFLYEETDTPSPSRNGLPLRCCSVT